MKISQHEVKGFTFFNAPIDGVDLPLSFTFPFFYTPHPLCELAVSELQTYLKSQQEIDHDFGLTTSTGVGKMFGVLLVKDKAGQIGYLSAFSGFLNDKRSFKQFVPAIIDEEERASFFDKGMAHINSLGQQIVDLETSEGFLLANREVIEIEQRYVSEVQSKKQDLKAEKLKRKKTREAALLKELSAQDYAILEDQLIKESLKDKFFLRELQSYWKEKLEQAKENLHRLESNIESLKEERKQASWVLQKKLFDQFKVLNAVGEQKSIFDIFKAVGADQPPSGSGECAAPKLLHYAFANNLEPLAMAEFWWGKSPRSEIRKHGNFYPSCTGKCEPILGHMLKGMKVDENPLHKNLGKDKEIEILFEDADLLVINKPEELLSVPGKHVYDSVFTRMKDCLPDNENPVIVHRLDQATSGIMLIAKSKEAHKRLQKQFIKRTIKKSYIALLEGEIATKEGSINLPLRLDIDNRPNQVVCNTHGKPALTEYRVLEVKNGRTRIEFFPITGRTHQLRVHAAHQLGLNTPIVGDDLYGQKSSRLHLHAHSITFLHPSLNEQMTFTKAPNF